MKKRCFITILTLVLALTACTITPDTIEVSINKDENINYHANIVSKTTAPDVNQPAVNPGNDNNVDTNGGDNNGVDTQVVDDSWKQLYANYLENEMDAYYSEHNPDWADGYTFGFIFVNDDDIPELVISTGYEAGGNTILTVVNDELYFLDTRRLGFFYDEYDNILINSDGHMGVYYDYVYTIGDDGFELLADGEYYELYDDADGYANEFEYYIDGEKVSVEEYTDKLESYIPNSDRLQWSSGSSYKSVLDYLKGNVYSNYKEAFRAVVEETLGRENYYYAFIEYDSDSPYLILDNNDWMYVYYYQDGVAFRGEDFYASDSAMNTLYLDTGIIHVYYETPQSLGIHNYIYTSNLGSNIFTYANRYGEYDEDGNLLKDEDGNYVFDWVINGESVSESEYENYLKQVTSGKSVIINPPSESNDEYYAYHSPEEMYDLLSE